MQHKNLKLKSFSCKVMSSPDSESASQWASLPARVASPWWRSAGSCRTSSGSAPWCPACLSLPEPPWSWWGRCPWCPDPEGDSHTQGVHSAPTWSFVWMSSRIPHLHGFVEPLCEERRLAPHTFDWKRRCGVEFRRWEWWAKKNSMCRRSECIYEFGKYEKHLHLLIYLGLLVQNPNVSHRLNF